MMSSIGDAGLGFVRCMSGADRHQVVGILTNVDNMSLADARVETRLPTQDLERARRWYADKLGLVATEEREGGLRYECAAGIFCLFASAGTPDGTFTQMAFNVDDIEAEMAELRDRGVVFEDYGIPGLPMVDGIVDIPGNYPSKGRGERGAWFRDSEGNLIGLGQAAR
jgi:catechol 2,3-dioxygenase-like lactoylglutathione lyase family enzyme